EALAERENLKSNILWKMAEKLGLLTRPCRHAMESGGDRRRNPNPPGLLMLRNPSRRFDHALHHLAFSRPFAWVCSECVRRDCCQRQARAWETQAFQCRRG